MQAKDMARYAPLAGVVAVVLWIVGVVVSETSNPPGDKALGPEIAAYFDADSTRILIAATLFGLGSAAFIWFLGSLTARLRATVGDGRLASIAFAAGTATATMWTCVIAPAAAGALAFDNRERNLSPETAETLDVLGDGFFVVAEFLAVAFMGAAALAILRGRAFPTWFGWITALLAVVLIFGPIGWAALIFGLPLWTIAVSVWLFVSQDRAEAPPRAVPSSS